jgi:hypothetical protein
MVEYSVNGCPLLACNSFASPRVSCASNVSVALRLLSFSLLLSFILLHVQQILCLPVTVQQHKNPPCLLWLTQQHKKA